MEIKRYINFTVERGTKRPKRINEHGTTYILYVPKRVKIQQSEGETVKMIFNASLPSEIFSTIEVLPSLSKHNLRLRNSQSI